MSDRRVAIIIVTYNASKYLEELFSSLEKVNYPQDKFEIVVVDNASTDGTRENLKSQVSNLKSNGLQATSYKLQANTGFTGGNNIGLQYAIDHGFDYAYLLNQDTVVDPNFMKESVQVMESDEKTGAVQSLLLLYDKKDTIHSIGNQIHYLGFGYAEGYGQKVTSFKLQATSYEITYPSGAACLLRLATLKAVGLFNKDFFMYYEDTDLGWRMRLLGYKVYRAPKSRVFHKYEFSRSIKSYYYMERNRLIMILQNYKVLTLILFLPAFLCMELFVFLGSLRSRFWKEKLKSWIYFFHLDCWRKILYNRTYIQRGRKISDRKILKMMSGRIEYQDTENRIVKFLINPIFYLYFKIVQFIIFW